MKLLPIHRSSILILLLPILLLWAAESSNADDMTAVAMDTTLTGPKVSFSLDIMPLLKKNCLACHNTTRSRGGLNLESPDLMKKGGDSGSALTPGNPEESLLYISAAHLSDDYIMPPEGNKVNADNFKPDELKLLEEWISQGAETDFITSSDFEFEAENKIPDSIVALEFSADGNYIGIGKGNRLYVYSILNESCDTELRLSDTEKLNIGQQFAHHDLVNSLAFSPDTKTIATGDFREVKIWKLTEYEMQNLSSLNMPGIISAEHHLPEHTQYLWLGDTFGNVCVFNDNLKRTTKLKSNHKNRIINISSLNHGKYICTLSMDGTIDIWDSETLQIAGHSRLNETLAAATSDGESLLYSTKDGRIFISYFTEEQGMSPPVKIYESRGKSIDKLLALNKPDGSKEILFSNSAGSIHLAKVITEKSQLRLKDIWIKEYNPVEWCVSPSQSLLVMNDYDGMIYCINMANGSIIRMISGNKKINYQIWKSPLEKNFLKNELEYSDQNTKERESDLDHVRKRLDKAKNEGDILSSQLSEMDQKIEMLSLNLSKYSMDSEKIRLEIQTVQNCVNMISAEIEKIKSELLKNQHSLQLDEFQMMVEKFEMNCLQLGRNQENLAWINQKYQSEMDVINKELTALNKLKSEMNAEQERKRTELMLTLDELELSKSALDKAERMLSESMNYRQEVADQLKVGSKAVEEWKEKQYAVKRRIWSMHISADSRNLFTIDYSGNLIIWNLNDGTIIREHLFSEPYLIQSIIPQSQDINKKFIVITLGGQVGYLDLNNKWILDHVIGSLDQSSPFTERVYAMEFSPNGDYLVTSSGEPSRSGIIHIFETEKWNLMKTLSSQHSDLIFDLKHSKDGKFIATASADKYVRIFNCENWELIHTFEGHSHYVLGLDWHRNTRLLASSSADGSVKIWNRHAGIKQKDIKISEKEITSLVWENYQDTVIIGSGSGIVSRYDKEGKVIQKFISTNDYITVVGTSFNNDYIAAGTLDGMIYLWDTRNKDKMISFDPSQLVPPSN